MIENTYAASQALLLNESFDPFLLTKIVGGRPSMHFMWKKIGEKRRLIGNPNKPMRKLQKYFEEYIKSSVIEIVGNAGWRLCKMPSATAFKKKCNHVENARKHQEGTFFYITDISGAYKSINLERLAMLIVYIKRYEIYQDVITLDGLALNISSTIYLKQDPLFVSVHAFLKTFCSGLHGEGLAVGGPVSPYLVNLYCEAFIDGQLRKICKAKEIQFTRYADDFVFSRAIPITSEIRKDLRFCICAGDVKINHRKSFVLSRKMGTVFVTKVGLSSEDELTLHDFPHDKEAKLVFPQKKRRKLHGIIGSYLKMKMDWPAKVSGYVAEFLHHIRAVRSITSSDNKTFALCKIFESEWAKHKNRWGKH